MSRTLWPHLYSGRSTDHSLTVENTLITKHTEILCKWKNTLFWSFLVESKCLPNYQWTQLYYPSKIGPIFQGRNWVTRGAITHLYWHCGSPGLWSNPLPSILLLSLQVLLWALFSILPSSWWAYHSHSGVESPHISICSLFYEFPAHSSNCLLAISSLELPREGSELKLFFLNKPDPFLGLF